MQALAVLQKIGRGETRAGEVVPQDAIAWARTAVPIRFEIELELAGRKFVYSVAFELPKGFRELRIFEEELTADGETVFHRETAKVRRTRQGKEPDAVFSVDWHLVALPVIQDRGEDDPVGIVRRWLARIILLSPIPSRMAGDSREADDRAHAPSAAVEDIGNWFTSVVGAYPAAYGAIDSFLRQLMPDLKAILNPELRPGFRSLILQFGNGSGSFAVPFGALSDGEKCAFTGAMVLAARSVDHSVFCFWDEPDNHIGLQDAGKFTIALRQAFNSGGQFVATSHNPETIRHFSLDNTFLLHRRSHLEPVQLRSLSGVEVTGDIVTALMLGDLEP